MRSTALVLHRFLTVVGVACVATWATVTTLGRVANARNSTRLADLIRARAASPFSSGLHHRVEAGDLVGRVDIPRVGIATVVLEGTDERELEQAAGHIPGTALPGEDGNVGIAAHRDSYFRPLRDVKAGDLVTLTTPDEVRSYRVATVAIVAPTDPGPLADTAANRLTLVTCYPFNYVGTAPYRYVVVADEVGSPHRAAAEDLRAGVVAIHPPRPAPRHRVVHLPRPHALTVPVAHASPSDTTSDVSPPTQPARKLPWWKRLFHRRHGDQNTQPGA